MLCCCLVPKLCPTLCNPMDCGSARLPCPSRSPGVCSTHGRWVGDASQPLHPLSSPSLPAFSLSQHQGLFQWVSSSHQAAKVLELQLQHRSFKWILRIDFLEDWLILSPSCPRDSEDCSPTPHFKSINSSVLSLLNGPTLTSVCDCWKNHGSDYMELVGKVLPLLFNMLFRFVIAFLPRSSCLLISWLQALSAVILEPQKRKSVTASTFPLLFAMKWWDRMPLS